MKVFYSIVGKANSRYIHPSGQPNTQKYKLQITIPTCVPDYTTSPGWIKLDAKINALKKRGALPKLY